MDRLNKLYNLQQEILSFGDVVNQAKNPADTDFLNACELFSQHLCYQLKTINAGICLQDIRPEMQQTTAQLCELSELITPDINNDNNCQWPQKLLNFCDQLQVLKSEAA